MRIFLVTAAAAITLVGTPAMAASEPAATQVAESDATKMVCRRVEVLGSRLEKKRVCMTAAEWASRRDADRKSIEQSQTQRYPGNSG